MSSVGVQEPRPPYIRFEKRAREVRDFAGKPTWVDVDYAIVTPHGSKDNTEKVMEEWIPILKQQIKEGRFFQSWFDAYVGAYRAWKADQEPPVNGTAITNWPNASPAEIKILKALGIVAVEDLAQANEELIATIGMGGRSLVDRAKAFVKINQDGTGDIIRKLDAMQAQLNALNLRNEQLESQKSQLEGELHRARNYMGQVAAAGVPPVMEHYRELVDTGPSDDALVNQVVAEGIQ